MAFFVPIETYIARTARAIVEADVAGIDGRTTNARHTCGALSVADAGNDDHLQCHGQDVAASWF